MLALETVATKLVISRIRKELVKPSRPVKSPARVALAAAACIQFAILAALFFWKLDSWGGSSGSSPVFMVTMIESNDDDTETNDGGEMESAEKLAIKTPANHPFPDDILSVEADAASWSWPEPALPEVAADESAADYRDGTSLEIERGNLLPQQRKHAEKAGNAAQTVAQTLAAGAGEEAPTKLASYKDSPAPPYPPEARRARQEGVVMLMIRIDKEGVPVRVSIAKSSGVQALDDVSVQWVRKNWTFYPALEDRTPVASDMMAPVRFKLN